jgi:hypothetical protein
MNSLILCLMFLELILYDLIFSRNFNKILTKIEPSARKQANVIPFLKPGKNPSDPNSYTSDPYAYRTK